MARSVRLHTIAGGAVLSTNAILTGLGLVIVLAVACRLVAARSGIPAIVLLLPVGFIAGAITDDVDPEKLFGATFEPLIDLGVGVILFEAGLRLRFHELGGGIRRVVMRLISVGTLLTLAGVAAAVFGIFGLSWAISTLLGAILVVSGPTVVLPLLAFVRPSERVRSVLKWEGTLIDPIGALLGVIAFNAVLQGAAGDRPFHPGGMASSLAIGLAVGLAGAVALWLVLRNLQRSAPGHGVAAALMILAAVIVGADLLRTDSGLLAAAVLGMAIANQRQLDVSKILEFHGSLVSLLIGMLFVLISASVEPSQVRDVVGEGIGLIAVMVFVIRPLVVAATTWRSRLTLRERVFVAWMAPRGIVAAATASTFGLELTQAHVSGADQILPIAFIVIFGTVVLYGLTAAPVARLLGVAGAGAPVILVVGGHAWARAIAKSLKTGGVGVRLWTGRPDEQAEARAAGLDAGNARLGVDAETREAELENVNQALLMTESDDFNALAAFELRQQLGSERVFRLPAEEGALDLVPTYAEGGILFAQDLTFAELERRFDAGARIVEVPADGGTGPGDGLTPLFAITAQGDLRVATAGARLQAGPGERAICLLEGPAPSSP
jgi:NhaP-type Na+/H+ or K+/H+ antiporter